jgi:deoxyribonuclease-4
MKLLGAHLSISKGIETVQEQMDLLNCETCAIFLTNQKRFSNPPISSDTAATFQKLVKNPKILLPHAPYVINLAYFSEKHFDCFLDDLIRCNDLGIKYYNIHPGSDTFKSGKKETARCIAENLNRAHKLVPNVVICIENMAGQGNTFGSTFEELAEIIEQITDKSRIGITLDTCHMFCAGYDIRSAENFEKIMKEFDRIVGFKYLKALHLNDSKNDFNTKKDRHECLGKGFIGLDAFRYIMQSENFENIPMVLETPLPELYGDELKLLRSFIK